MSNTRNTRSIHPGFPTNEEVKQNEKNGENSSVIYSDHLPVLLEVPDKKLKIISYNVIGACQTDGSAFMSKEDDEGAKARYQRIAEGLQKTTKAQGAGVIFLQETSDNFLVPCLKKALGDDWVIVQGNNNVITCYDSTQFKVLPLIEMNGKTINQTTERDEHILTIKLHDKNNNDIYVLKNIWGEYCDNPVRAESVFKDQFKGHEIRGENNIPYRQDIQENEICIMAGDSNTRIAPLHNNKANLTVGLMPPVFFTKQEQFKDYPQMPDFPDGGFCRGPNTEGKIKQLNMKVIDITTGQLFNAENLKPTSADKNIYYPPLPVMCLDDSYQNTPIINDDTLFQIEKRMNERFNIKYPPQSDNVKDLLNELENQIVVRKAVNVFNEPSIAIIFPKTLINEFAVFEHFFPKDKGFRYNSFEQGPNRPNETASQGCIYAPPDQVNLMFYYLNLDESEFVNLSQEIVNTSFWEGKAKSLMGLDSTKIPDGIEQIRQCLLNYTKENIESREIKKGEIEEIKRNIGNLKKKNQIAASVIEVILAKPDSVKTYFDLTTPEEKKSHLEKLLAEKKHLNADNKIPENEIIRTVINELTTLMDGWLKEINKHVSENNLSRKEPFNAKELLSSWDNVNKELNEKEIPLKYYQKKARFMEADLIVKDKDIANQKKEIINKYREMVKKENSLLSKVHREITTIATKKNAEEEKRTSGKHSTVKKLFSPISSAIGQKDETKEFYQKIGLADENKNSREILAKQIANLKEYKKSHFTPLSTTSASLLKSNK